MFVVLNVDVRASRIPSYDHFCDRHVCYFRAPLLQHHEPLQLCSTCSALMPLASCSAEVGGSISMLPAVCLRT